MEYYEENNEAHQTEHVSSAVIKVIGLGGGGGNAVSYMAGKSSVGVDFVCANTDAQALNKISIEKKICMGLKSTTKGLGAGMDVQKGGAAALEDKETLKTEIRGADMLFIAAGMGGGTGTGSAPVVAEIAKEEGILTVAVITKPFSFEGSKKKTIAENGVKLLMEHVDSLIVLPNEKLLSMTGVADDIEAVFSYSDEVLANAVSAITDLITQTGRINVDFADVKTVMSAPGKAMMGTGIACGDNRASEAAKQALSNPLTEGIELNNATGVLVNISGKNISISEYSLVGEMISHYCADNADIKVGVTYDDEMTEEEIKVTLIVTGLSGHRLVDEKMLGNSDVKVANGENIAQYDDENFIDAQRINPQDLSHRMDDADLPAYLRKQRA